MQDAKMTRRFVGIDLGKRGYVLRVIAGKRLLAGAGRAELIARLRATDVIAVEACNSFEIASLRFQNTSFACAKLATPGADLRVRSLVEW